MEEEAGIKAEKNGLEDKNIKEEIFSRVVRAGKRTYFFDVKATRNEDYYLTITESKKRLGNEGKIYYEKHKVFLYKEDFEKFSDGLKDVISFIDNGKDDFEAPHPSTDNEPVSKEYPLTTEEFTNVNFEDLGEK
jgi:maltoporin